MKFVQTRPLQLPNRSEPGGYPYPNEALGPIHELTALCATSKVAAICSGGEVPLICMLPRAKQVFAVDHSKYSLSYAMTKAMIIEQHAPEMALNILRGTSMLPDFASLTLPAPLTPQVGASKYWNLVSIDDMIRIKARINNITFIWGDVNHVANFGTDFDLFYASNAMQHNRAIEGSMPSLDDFFKCLRPHGHVLYTTAGNSSPRLGHLTAQKTRGPYGASMSWAYSLVSKGASR